MNQITDGPNTYDFGLDFNYAVWPKDTIVSLVNVPWNNDYRDIVKFSNANSLKVYVDGLESAGTRVTGVSYIKPNTPIRLQIPFNKAVKYNYLRASNPLQPLSGGDVQRDFFYFVTDVRYVAPDTTEFVLQLDVWTSYQFDASFGYCYIERGHIGVANENAFDNYGRDYLTVPEGLDVGGEMQVVTKASKALMAADGTGAGGDLSLIPQAYDILVCSTVNLLATDFGTAAAPKLQTAPGGRPFGMPSGASYYVWSGKDTGFSVWLNGMKDKPWITQGIISITMIPRITKYIPGFVFNNLGGPTEAPETPIPPAIYAMMNNWRDNAAFTNYIPDRYSHLKKLFTFPYMAIELTTFTGTPIIVKPESWADANATVMERVSPIPPSQRIAISPYKYNAIPGSPTDSRIPGLANLPGGDDNGDFVDFATQMSNLPSLAIVNDGAISYMASNMNSIAYQYQSADWAQQRALGSNEVGYDQSSAGMNLANDLTGIGIGADTASTGISNNLEAQRAIIGGVGAIAGGVGGGAAGIAGGVGAAAMGGVQAAMNISASQQQLSVRNKAAGSSNRAQVNTAGYMRDTNKTLADWAARGDYANSIAAINAKVQDARLTQPTTSGQVGGEMMNIINNHAFISARFKMIDHAAMSVVCEYWLRYGYSVRRFAIIPPNLNVMSHFTYWKLSETYIIAATMPEGFKQVIRGIFEKGVTVWRSAAYIGVTDPGDNIPVGGFTL